MFYDSFSLGSYRNFIEWISCQNFIVWIQQFHRHAYFLSVLLSKLSFFHFLIHYPIFVYSFSSKTILKMFLLFICLCSIHHYSSENIYLTKSIFVMPKTKTHNSTVLSAADKYLFCFVLF